MGAQHILYDNATVSVYICRPKKKQQLPYWLEM